MEGALNSYHEQIKSMNANIDDLMDSYNAKILTQEEYIELQKKFYMLREQMEKEAEVCAQDVEDAHKRIIEIESRI